MAAERRKSPALGIIALVFGALFVVGFIFGEIGRKLAEQFLGVEVPAIVGAPEVHIAAGNLLNAEHEFHMPSSFWAFALTNTMLSSFLASIVLLLLFVPAGLRARLVPGRLQGIVESFMEWMLGFCEAVAGPRLGRVFFPFIATIFLFVSFNAWMGLMPFYNTIIVDDGHGHTITLFRPAGTDLNMPLALALISFIFVEFWGVKELGLHYFGKFFRFGELLHGRVFNGIVELFVGLLELLSEFIRIVSFTFRLFGNMFAGEVVILMFTFLTPLLLTLPFYGLEVFVGVIQAFIFAMLTLVFGVMAVSHGEHAGEAHEAEAGHGEEATAVAVHTPR